MDASNTINHEDLSRFLPIDPVSKEILSIPDFFIPDSNTLFLLCSFVATHGLHLHPQIRHQIDPDTMQWEHLDIQKAREYLCSILMAPKPSRGLEAMRTSGILELALPELYHCVGVDQKKDFHKYDVYYHSIYSCDFAEPRLIIRLAALLHDIGKPQSRRLHENKENGEEHATFYNHEMYSARISRGILKRYHFDKDVSKQVLHLIKHHMFHYTREWTDSAVRRFMRNVGLENLDDLLALRHADRMGSGLKHGPSRKLNVLREHIQHLIDEENRFSLKDLDIDGKILMDELDLKPSRLIGEILNHLFTEVEEDKIPNQQTALLNEAHHFLANIDSQKGV